MKKKIVYDMILNIVATAFPVAMLQLIIYPHVAKVLGEDEYGLMLTIYSMWILISNSMGNVLNNIKLLKMPAYNEIGTVGDIKIFLRRWLAASSLILFFLIWFYFGDFSPIHIVCGIIAGACIFLKAYLEVGFRIVLDYKAIVVNNVLLSVGLFIGYLLFGLTGLWELIFIVGYAMSVLYCLFKTGLMSEPATKTALYGEVTKDSYSLLSASVISNLVSYADKLVLYPLMGGFAVSIYYTATILGKITGMLTGPINSVVLSYITRWDNSKRGVFSKILTLIALIGVVGYVVTLLLARPVIGLLFPQWVEEVVAIMPITTITVMLTIMTSFLQPFVLKYCEAKWQILISGIGLVVYFASALILWKISGIRGFCIGTVIGAIAKLVAMIVIYYRKAPLAEGMEK